MAKKDFFVHLDLLGNEIQNGVIQNLATAPASPKKGQLYLDTNTNILLVYNGTTWLKAAVVDGAVGTKGIVELSNLYNGTSETKATTEKGLSDGLATKQDALGYVAENVANKGQANGYAGLDANGLLDLGVIPAAAIPTLKIVADETARFALTTSDVQNGDTVKQTDTDTMYYVKDQDNLDSESGYEVYKASVSWSSVSGKPADIFYKNTDTLDNITEGTTNKHLTSTLKTNYDEAYTKIGQVGTKVVDETDIGDNKMLVYNNTSGELQYIAKPDGITNLSIGTKTSTTVDINSDTGNNATIPQATTSEAGLLSAADKVRIDGIESLGSYNGTFVSGDFSSGTLTIAAATHGLGTGKNFAVIVKDSSDSVIVTGLHFNASGDIDITVNTGLEFDGSYSIKKI